MARWEKKIIGLVLGYGLFYYGWLWLIPSGSFLLVLGGNIISLLGILGATGITLISGIRIKDEYRYFWWILTLGNLHYLVAEVLWNYYELILQVEVPFPGWIEFFCSMQILFYMLALAYLFYRGRDIFGLGRYIFDSIIIMTVVSTIVYNYIIYPLSIYGEDYLLYMLASISYPIGDLGLLFGAFVLYLSNYSIFPKKMMSLICLGLVLQALADLLYSFMMLTEIYASGSFFDPVWPLALLFVGITGLLYQEGEGSGLQGKVYQHKVYQGKVYQGEVLYPDKFRLFLPYLSVIVLLIILLLQQPRLEALFIGFNIAVLLIILRQIVILLENKSLVVELATLNRDLEGKVELRTQELREANTALIKAGEFKDDIISSMSHELRTPIHVILNYISLIGEDGDALPEGVKADLHVITRNSKRLLYIIDNLVYLAQTHNSKGSIILERVAIKELVQHTYEEFYYLATEKGLDFTLDIECQQEFILFDPVKLQQILSNLVMNAIKFTHQGSIRLTAKAHTKDLELIVEDTGIGIPQECYDAIFERFYQVDRGIRKKYGGTGIGLSIVKSLVDLLGGSIGLESQLNKGTRFTLAFPLEEDNWKESG